MKGIGNNKKGLTPKQHDFLAKIKEFIAANGYPPSYEEMKQFTGLKSKSNVHAKMAQLKTRGYIDFDKYMARSLRVL